MINPKNNVLRKLITIKLVDKPSLPKLTSFALCYSTAEYERPGWERFCCAKNCMQPYLLPLIGYLKPTSNKYLYILLRNVPPKREVACRVECQRQTSDDRRFLYGRTAESQRQKPMKSFHSYAITLDQWFPTFVMARTPKIS